MPFVSTEEKTDDISHLRRQIDNFLIQPALTAKFKNEVEENLIAGFTDFLIYREYSTDFKNGKKKGRISASPAWGGADQGFYIRANNIIDILDTISYIFDIHPDYNIIYFVCTSPDMGHPRVNTVDETKRGYNDTINELQLPSSYVLDHFYDR